MQTRNDMYQVISRSLITAMLLAAAIPSASAESKAATSKKMLEQILTGIQDPAMRKLWQDAYDAGTLPALDKVPIPAHPVSQRTPYTIKAVAAEPRRPVIANTTTIDIQPYSSVPRNSYQGNYRILKHEPGLISGKLDDQAEAFEIFYKLPGDVQLSKLKTSATYQLTYTDEVMDSAQQRRIVLFDPETRHIPLAVIAEGANKPYSTTIDETGISIKQHANGPNPPVTISYQGMTVVLRQGEHKQLGKNDKRIRVNLVSSYHQSPGADSLTEGQPYYIKIFIYQ